MRTECRSGGCRIGVRLMMKRGYGQNLTHLNRFCFSRISFCSLFFSEDLLYFGGGLLQRRFDAGLTGQCLLNRCSSRQRNFWITRSAVLRSGTGGIHLIDERLQDWIGFALLLGDAANRRNIVERVADLAKAF